MAILVGNLLFDHEPVVVDITEDQIEPYGDDDDHQYVYGSGNQDLTAAGHLYLVIGNLHIMMTDEQEAKIRYFFMNT